MPERTTADALDHFLDALVTGAAPAATSDPELAALARRYVALGKAPAPPGARERVWRRVIRQAGPRHNGRPAPNDPTLLLLRLGPDGQPASPAGLQHPRPGPIAPGSRDPAFRWRAWTAGLLVLAVLVAALAWAQRPDNLALVIPAADPVAPPPTSPPSAAGQAVFDIVLPAGSLPIAAYGVTFDYRTMPPQRTSSEASAGPLLFRFIAAGQVQVQSDGSLAIWQADDPGEWQPVPAGTPHLLTAGDAIFLQGAASLTWTNTATTPVAVIAWQMTDQGGGNSDVPAGWTLHDQAAVHMAIREYPDQPARLVLRRVDLPPGTEIAPPPGSWLSHFVALDQNAAGEVVAPMFGKLPGGAWRNVGRQELIVYQYSLDSPGTPAAPGVDGSP